MDTWLIRTSHCDFNVIMDVNVMTSLTVVPKNLVCGLDCWGFFSLVHIKYKRGFQPQYKTEIGGYRQRRE